MKSPKFSGNKEEKSFKTACDEVVDGYFVEHNIPRTGNRALRIKASLVSITYLLSYISIITLIKDPWLALAMVVIFSLAQVAVGMCVMHDASHGAFSEKPWVNILLSKTIWLMGFNDTNWNIQHNGLHHINTNLKRDAEILGDEDIEAYNLLRLSEHGQRKPMYHYQHLYAWPLYMIVTFGRFFTETFRISSYLKMGIGKRFNIKPGFEYGKIISIKIIFLTLILAIPLVSTDFSWWQIGIGYFTMNFVSSFCFTLIFQLAHIVTQAKQPPLVNGIVHNDWFIHEMYSSCDFVTNPLFRSLIGGLNRQTIHHGWRDISHVHYEPLAELLKPVFIEYKVPYNENPSFSQAIVSHYQRLEQLGTT